MSVSCINEPLISIIIVVYNAEVSLEQTILSVVNQTYKNIELVIIDGGSKDGTIDIIKRYEEFVKYWTSEPDNGIYDAMNKGIEVVNGSWVLFLGAGDILLNVLNKIVARFTNSYTLYYGDVYRYDLLKVYNGRYNGFKLSVVNICHQAIFYPLCSLKKYNYNLKYRTLADHDLNMNIYGDKNFYFKYINVIISIYEGGGFSKINEADLPFFADKLKIIRRNFSIYVFAYAFLRKKLAILVSKI